MQVSADGTHVYFPWIVYRQNPITAENIRRGWVLASRIARVRLDGQARREAIALDPQGQAVGDPHGLALSPDEQTLVCTASGTHELLVLQAARAAVSGLRRAGRPHRRSAAEGPRAVRPHPAGRSADGGALFEARRQVYVANYLLNAIQVVDVASRKLTQNHRAEPRLGAVIVGPPGRSHFLRRRPLARSMVQLPQLPL